MLSNGSTYAISTTYYGSTAVSRIEHAIRMAEWDRRMAEIEAMQRELEEDIEPYLRGFKGTRAASQDWHSRAAPRPHTRPTGGLREFRRSPGHTR